MAGAVALQQLTVQDYPSDRIAEIVVGGAKELSTEVPTELQGLLRDFSTNEDALNIAQELAKCTGDLVVFWGDDHVSAPSRLRKQVATAKDTEAATVLQPQWFFDPEDGDFQKVRKWPIAEFQEFIEKQAEGSKSMPQSFAQLMVCADPLTLVGSRHILTTACEELRPSASPNEELKELLLKLIKVKQPKIIEDLQWAAVRAPPSAATYGPATPEGNLARLVQAAYTAGPSKRSSKYALRDAVAEVQEKKMAPAAAIDRILAEETSKPPQQADLDRIRKAVAQSLARSGESGAAAAVKSLTEWYGLTPGEGGVREAKNFPVVFSIFQAVRSYVSDNADFWGVVVMSEVAEGLVKLAQKLWASDARVNEALAKALTKELIGNDWSNLETDGNLKTADIVGTLGLRDPLESISYAAMDLPNDGLPVDALATLAWSFGEAGVENTALQMKVAKGIITQSDKLMPPDIGRLFIAMHERKWFKDQQTVQYLTESMMSRVRDLKKNDPGLAKILAASAAR